MDNEKNNWIENLATIYKDYLNKELYQPTSAMDEFFCFDPPILFSLFYNLQ